MKPNKKYGKTNTRRMQLIKKHQDPLYVRYSGNPWLRALLRFIPCGIGSAFDVVAVDFMQHYLAERQYAFYDELAEGTIQLNTETIKSDSFLHAYFSTCKFVLQAGSKEKCRLFARLLKATIADLNLVASGKHDEYLQILAELSPRELMLLSILDKHEITARNDADANNDPLHRACKIWDAFTKEACQALQISSGELKGMLTRLNRTGCYETITGAYFSYTGDRGNLTDLYYQLKKHIVGQEGHL